MTPEFAVELVKNLMFQAIALATPILMVAMAIGLGVSIFQAVSSIHEQTLSFVPKALGIVGVMIVLLPWLLRTTIEFTTAVLQKMPEMVR
jgi:flagellar biosynthesis protein FliQ